MTDITLQVTSGPSDDDPVLADLNDGSLCWVGPGYNLGRGQAIYDGGERTATLPLVLTGSESRVVGRAAQIVRACRVGKWLRFKRTSTSVPSWLRIVAISGDGALDRIARGEDGTWRWELELTCEGAAYGALVTVPPTTIGNDPVPTTDGSFRVALPTIRGDVPTPLTVTLTPSVTWAGFRPLVNVAPTDTVTIWDIDGDVGGLGLNTTATVTRLMETAPLPGRYRVWAQVSPPDTSTRFSVGRVFDSSDTRWGPWRTIASSDPGRWIDVGEMAFPVAGDIDDLVAADVVAPTLSFRAAQAYGYGPPVGAYVIIYAVALVPIRTALGEATTTMVQESTKAAANVSTRLIIDGNRRRVLHRTVISNNAELMTTNQRGFETSVADWTAGGTVPPTLSQSSTRAHAGTKSMLITWGAGGSFPNAGTTVTGLTADTRYRATAWVYVPTGNPKVGIVAGGIRLGAQSTYFDDWQQVAVDFTATGTSFLLQLWPDNTPPPTAGQVAYVDDLSVKAVDDFDGALAQVPQPEVSGGWPCAAPGVPNTLTLLHQTGNKASVAAEDEDATCRVSIAYHPRWLNLAAE